MNWSEDQQKVIKASDSSILVSAAAGSGKTAVMVERVIRMISDEESGAGLNDLIIMTFTKAAAAGMKAKISDALSAKIAEEPDNKKLRLQRAILPRARISTVDSFCEGLIKQHYQSIDIDPGFRLLDEGESGMLKSDALSAVLEEKFAEGDPGFLRLMDFASVKARDKRIETLVDKIYRFIMGEPWPEECLEAMLKDCEAEESGDISGCRWYGSLMESVKKEAAEEAELLNMALRVCDAEDGPSKYRPAIEESIEMAQHIAGCGDYESVRAYLESLEFSSFIRKNKKDGYDEAKVKLVKDLRNEGFKKYIEGLRKNRFLLSWEELRTSAAGAAGINKELIKLTAEFKDRYESLKKDKNVLDFNDLEHMALRLLYIEKDGRHVPSELADEISRGLKEIMIDEYQDSNSVQEALLYALSAERFGRYDVFMVGDVKQSIYRFRNAKPQLFTDKYNSFARGEGVPERKIELNCNFRSRAEVLNSANDVFDVIMKKDFGGIEYDDAARLKCMADYPEGTGFKTELLLLDTDNDGEDEDDDEYELSAEEYEYSLIAKRIEELIRPRDAAKRFMVKDKDTGLMRPARYSDITILVRKKRFAMSAADILKKNGIPAFFENGEGYFEAKEVDLVLGFLKIIDNPFQDIPLAAVLKSPIGNFSDDDMALIRAEFEDARINENSASEFRPGDFYRALKLYAANGPESCLKAKCSEFLKLLVSCRDKADILPVHVLLNDIYLETGYYDYVSALPLGTVRRKNLDMLLEKAEAYGKTSYQGLFNFVRYIDALKKYRSEYAEASALSENDDVVRITTIHKSKGLEYPIVIIARAGAQLSGKGEDETVMVSEYGVGSDYVDPSTNIRYPSAKKAFIKKERQKEDLAEEERLLYVAMTRAMEKLIITASGSNLRERCENVLQSMSAVGTGSGGAVLAPVGMIKKAKAYLDWVLMGAAAHGDDFDIRFLDAAGLKAEEKTELTEKISEVFEIKKALGGKVNDAAEAAGAAEILKSMNAKYAHEAETMLRPKVSVSDIKMMAIENLESGGKVLNVDDEGRPEGYGAGSVFAHGAEPGAGALRGTAFHRAMELLPYKGTDEEQLKAVLDDRRFPENEKALLNKEAVLRFLKSGLAGRMKEAHEKGKLYRERHFMAGFPAESLIKGQNSGELQILQGIIDAYFEEDGGIVLLDYKTDRVDNASELEERYRTQLNLYKRALEALTGRRVTESIIYSTFLNEEIAVKEEV